MAAWITWITVIPVLFLLMQIVFKRLQLYTKNYKGYDVPYSAGTVLMSIIFIDYLFLHTTVTTVTAFVYLLSLWVLGLIDDRFGSAYPKGIKGHFSYAIKRKIYTTGFLKAVGTVVVTTFILFFSYQGENLILFPFHFLLLILTPHVMNLMDTKPLRVCKLLSLILLLLTPVLLANNQLLVTLIWIILCWFIFEGKLTSMLGDNGSMLIGGWAAIMVINHTSILVEFIFMTFCISLTLFAERSSIQEWISKTPVLNEFDRWGRINE